jgi:ribonuclease HII
VGVDEVGVGCIAGPVVAAAVVLVPGVRRVNGVRDSKVLSAAERESLAPRIRTTAATIALGAASVPEIDRLNILRATHLAMRRALARIGAFDHALVDGREVRDMNLGGPFTAIVDGDATCYAIACASIVAKVARDRLMTRIATRFPGYGWEHNVGYGTPEHLATVRTLGVTPLHRRSFAPVRLCEQEQLGLVFEDAGAGS